MKNYTKIFDDVITSSSDSKRHSFEQKGTYYKTLDRLDWNDLLKDLVEEVPEAKAIFSYDSEHDVFVVVCSDLAKLNYYCHEHILNCLKDLFRYYRHEKTAAASQALLNVLLVIRLMKIPVPETLLVSYLENDDFPVKIKSEVALALSKIYPDSNFWKDNVLDGIPASLILPFVLKHKRENPKKALNLLCNAAGVEKNEQRKFQAPIFYILLAFIKQNKTVPEFTDLFYKLPAWVQKIIVDQIFDRKELSQLAIHVPANFELPPENIDDDQLAIILNTENHLITY